MKLPGTCSISKESHKKKKKKKMGLLFRGSGTPTFWLGLLLFTKRESRTPTFKILVRTLLVCTISCEPVTEFLPWILNWDIIKNRLDFGDLDLILKLIVVEKLKILSWGTSF